jgi:hypothetical protein
MIESSDPAPWTAALVFKRFPAILFTDFGSVGWFLSTVLHDGLALGKGTASAVPIIIKRKRL